MSNQTKVSLVSVILAWLVALVLLNLPYWDNVESRLYDYASILTAPNSTQLPITIVAIDEASFSQINAQWPWPRKIHAELIDKLILSGAAVIAFDIIFSESSDEENDTILRDSIEGTFGAVVLAADHSFHETAFVRHWLRVDPLEMFTEAGAVSGLATISLDNDNVVRQFPVENDAFWRQIIRTLIMMRPGIVEEPDVPENSLIKYIGPPDTFPKVSYYQVLNEDSSIPEGFFQDQIVLVGRDVRSHLSDGSAHGDMFATSFTANSGMLTSGVEIHATLIENALMGLSIRQFEKFYTVIALSFVALLSLPAVIRWHLFKSLLKLLIVGVSSTVLSIYLLENESLWLPLTYTFMMLLVMYVSTGLGAYMLERRRTTEIKDAFSKYVSPGVVEQMINQKERIRLNGEKREMTMLFSDLAGFTAFTEKLEVESVHKIINSYLSAMTHVIHQYDGTVVDFMGDGIMAFWGAPVKDELHALHATEAALEMQNKLSELEKELSQYGAGKLSMRVGINTGNVIVGNMGSDERFAYTALGDATNLASRLEGVNKYYGTGIIVSDTSAVYVKDHIRLRYVDLVKVKGKEKAVFIFTPCEDQELATLTEEAFTAYKNQQWDLAQELWQRVAKKNRNDPLANVFLKRVADYKLDPPGDDWDGATSLEK